MPGPRETPPVRVGLRCDGSAAAGVGHVTRCLAVADELATRGAAVTLLGEVSGAAWLEQQVAARGLAPLPAPPTAAALADLAGSLALDAVVLDGYTLDRDAGAALRARGVTVLSVVDGPFGTGQEADVYLDQNLGARPAPGPEPAARLLGLRYVLVRDEVLRHRGCRREARQPPLVLAVFGGTDAFGAAPVVVPLLLATGQPMELVAVAGSSTAAAALEMLRGAHLGPGQTLEVVPPTPDLARRAAASDLVVSAAGTSLWELLCVGAPTAAVAVTDNQEVGYEAVLDAGVVAPVGRLERLRSDPAERAAAVHTLHRLLRDPGGRARLADRGTRLVDGRGRVRVVDALLGAVVGRAS